MTSTPTASQTASEAPDVAAVAPAAPRPQMKRKPGEAVFALLVALASAGLMWSAYDISGFESLSAPGTVPMVTAFAMFVAAVITAAQTLRLPAMGGSFLREVLPLNVVLMALLLLAYGFALKPLGFLPTSAIFLIAAIKLLAKRSWGFTVLVSLASLIGIYFVFRVVFTVLMPAGIVPEGEMIQFFRNLLSKGQS
ncbi:Tripartite tricarboxylate transporter TctB family protein [Aquimixticola soesokkakensis]|uniref:Tripartite tricarboxylate transporter TctB family protein n=1 Tax=Aquimixticola soesokkakensis TaxID=1519096 RepID=A0A1Y5SW12_9RHOB|nr:tripartite tricarboxylate transporter TctB family protein [Aquimixticola soesokkakensis]SLN48258.1 Tripartite tricarboxylate transporter TctB family protein [Aquimixticola soesokkakensis]